MKFRNYIHLLLVCAGVCLLSSCLFIDLEQDGFENVPFYTDAADAVLLEERPGREGIVNLYLMEPDVYRQGLELCGTGRGIILTLAADLSAPGYGLQGDFRLLDAPVPGAILAGTRKGDSYYGSYLFSHRSTRDPVYMDPVSGGRCSILFDGSSYHVSGQVIVGKSRVRFNYSGKIRISYGGGGEIPDVNPDGVIRADRFTQGRVDFLGEALGIQNRGYSSWMLLLADDQVNLGSGTPQGGVSGNGELFQFEMISHPLYPPVYELEIPEGHYEIRYRDLNPSIFDPWNLLFAYTEQGPDGHDVNYGTWYYGREDRYVVGATSGYVEISRIPRGYEVVYQIDDATQGLSVVGSYRGPLYHRDCSRSVLASRSSSMSSRTSVLASRSSSMSSRSSCR